jgi:hypothetical protein
MSTPKETNWETVEQEILATTDKMSVDDLARKIKGAAKKSRLGLRTSLQQAFLCGYYLCLVRDRLKEEKGFVEFCEGCGLSYKQCNKYCRLYEEYRDDLDTLHRLAEDGAPINSVLKPRRPKPSPPPPPDPEDEAPELADAVTDDPTPEPAPTPASPDPTPDAPPKPPPEPLTVLGQATLDVVCDVVSASDAGMGYLTWAVGKNRDVIAEVARRLGKKRESIKGALAHLEATGYVITQTWNVDTGEDQPDGDNTVITLQGWLAYSKWDADRAARDQQFDTTAEYMAWDGEGMEGVGHYMFPPEPEPESDAAAKDAAAEDDIPITSFDVLSTGKRFTLTLTNKEEGLGYVFPLTPDQAIALGEMLIHRAKKFLEERRAAAADRNGILKLTDAAKPKKKIKN